jgi:hypothetical protein
MTATARGSQNTVRRDQTHLNEGQVILKAYDEIINIIVVLIDNGRLVLVVAHLQLRAKDYKNRA